MGTRYRATGTYYILVKDESYPTQFFVLGPDGEMGVSRCPHDATLFTSRGRATDLAQQWKRGLSGVETQVVSAVKRDPRVVVG